MKKTILTIIMVALVAGTAMFVVKYTQKPKPNLSTTQINLFVPQQSVTDEFIHDKDRDGVPDTEEDALGLSDYELDSDKDGLSDYAEIKKWKTNPAEVDTDGDGYGDAIEILNGFNPLGHGKLPQ